MATLPWRANPARARRASGARRQAHSERARPKTTNPRFRRSVQGDFTRVAGNYARLATERGEGQARKLLAWIKPRPSERILDAACGPGTLAHALARQRVQVTGLDICPRMIRAAQGRARPAHGPALLGFVLGDVERLPYPTGHFHRVVCTYAFANFPDPLRILREFARVTRPKGRIYVVDVLAPEEPARAAYLNLLETQRGRCYTRILKRTEFLALFRQAHLRLGSSKLARARRTFRHWLRLSPAGASRARAHRLRQMLLASIPGDQAGLRPRRVGNEIVFEHTSGWFLLRKNEDVRRDPAFWRGREES